MKTLILGLAAVYVLGAALPAAADDRDHRDGAIVHPAAAHHHRHRVVWFDSHHHRHVSWR